MHGMLRLCEQRACLLQNCAHVDLFMSVGAVELMCSCLGHHWGTGKTPLAIYLGQRGYKVANLPLVPINGKFHIPKQLYEIDQVDGQPPSSPTDQCSFTCVVFTPSVYSISTKQSLCVHFAHKHTLT